MNCNCSLLILVIVAFYFHFVDNQSLNGPLSRPVEIFVNVYDHPKTGFSCQGKNPGQYYADPATKCAVYYVCIPNPTGTMSAQSFACPNGTIFSQATRVCRPHEEVFCPLALRYYDSINGNIDTGTELKHAEFSFQNAPAPRPKVTNMARPKSTQIITSNSAPVAAVPLQTNSFNTGRGFRNSRTFVSSTSTTTTTTTLPSPPQPSDLGIGDYEYDYADYNETGLVNAATSLQSTILNQDSTVVTNNSNEQVVKMKRRKRNTINFHKEQLNHKLNQPFVMKSTYSENHPISSDVFNCEDKIHGLAYADIESDCHRFYVCLSISKGKLMAYSFNCETGKRFNQQKGSCDLRISRKICQRSQHYYIYNKWYKSNKKHFLNLVNNKSL